MYFNLDKLLCGANYDDQVSSVKENRGLTRDQNYQDVVYLLLCMLTINKRKYICTLANAHSLIVRWEEIKPLSKAEEIDPYSVPFPIAITNVIPIESDPCGISYRELVFSHQRAMSKMMDSIYFKSLSNAGFKNHFVDIDVVDNIHALSDIPEN
jgi:hypothetical protein